MQKILQMNTKVNDFYGLKLLVTLLLLVMVLAYSSLYLIQNYYSNSFLSNGFNTKKLYFLESDSLKNMYDRYQMNYEEYQQRLEYFKTLASEYGYSSENIATKKLKELPDTSKLVVFDAMALNQDEIREITTFVTNGGKIIFNYTSGFLDSSLRYQETNLVKKIAGLALDSKIQSIKYDENATTDSSHLTMKILSPISKYIKGGVGLDMIVYDPLPVFNSKNLVADAYLTTWAQNNYSMLDEDTQLTKEQSGLIWHGYKEKGKWVYFSFPSYVFMGSSQKLYKKLFKGMLEYLDKDVITVPFPYIDAKNSIFVSEDTEYKFENLEQFYNISIKNDFPVTAFCVASLAQKYPELMAKVAKSELMEIGSHSYTHKKIVGEGDSVYKRETIGSKKLLYSLTKKPIVGFRPPREEIDEKMIQLLKEAGYEYILTEAENRLLPYMKDNIMIIPRHGTDDYSYLINLDWNASQILTQMKNEANLLTSLNGIYTMSAHSHLMSFSTNINILDNFFKYVNTQEEMRPMNGEMLQKRVRQSMNLSLSSIQTTKKIILTIDNYNRETIKDMHYMLFVDPNIKIVSIQSEIMGIKTNLEQVSFDRYELVIHSIEPQSQLVLFLDYE
ncbi:polysaccharide deacetylase family protein [Sulfurimonas sp. SWIR-19]|uniref:polysaccharide deacetylase family protein n=1 Tax=Sulfurimonas sp. SWIR-19 TaxID=2878390 RepID=UPI001CF5CCAA|nr:polysaccharide deacetylase family protein [Sulfurimonas sp. SWIR-19]UCM99431.1 polysaccharide deacetylase family protein [Sulfurimonas sp. SWIR-19]